MPRTRPKLNEEGLTDKESAFADEYVVDFNGKYAAIRIGVTPTNAATWAVRARRKPAVAAAIEKRLVQKRQQVQEMRDEVLNELRAIATSRHNHYLLDVDGSLTLNGVPLEQADKAHAAVKKIKRRTYYEKDRDGELSPVHEVEFELWDKNTALRNLGVHLGMFIERSADATDPEHPDGNATVWDFGGKKIEF